MSDLPVTLRYLVTTFSDMAPDIDGPVIRVQVDARTDTRSLVEALVTDRHWPVMLSDEEIKQAVSHCIGLSAIEQNIRPFPDAHPSFGPEYHLGEIEIYTVELPNGRYAIIDGISESILDIKDSLGEAWCEAWDRYNGMSLDNSDDPREPVYAYYAIDLPVPEGYKVGYSDDLQWFHNDGPEGLTANEHGFDTRLDACIAAWREKFRQAQATPEFAPGPVEKDYGEDYPRATIHHHTQDAGGTIWLSRIYVHGVDEANAIKMRDRLLDRLNALDQIHALLDNREWDADTPAAIARIVSEAGYTIRDPQFPETD